MKTVNDTIELGAQLRTARKQLGLTQPQLAMATGVGIRFIVDLEAGKPTVQLALVLRVVDALGGNVALIGLPENSTGALSDKSLSDE
jgi:y4mF family transcriptional regulator